MERVLVLVAALAVLSLGFGVLEWRFPAIRGQRKFRRAGYLTDVAWWLFTPTVGKLFTGIVVAVSIIGLGAVLGLGITGDHLRGIAERDTFIGRQPLLLQIGAFLLMADFLAYWSHRAHHTIGRLWKLHAVHHSSTEVDWLSSVRVHPLNDAIGSTIVATPLLLLGFSVGTLGVYLPFLTLYAIMLHANVSWSFGPLRLVLASPTYHRWHHSAEPAAVNKNYAGLFPFWDRVFGTLYMPKDRRPTTFGVVGDAPPAAFLPQLLYPFRSPRRHTAATIETA
jgi:sterol desaturase/sphingolipid hydroxylase (fatty acid hydroxylase superfamily)